jgi:hypothetical protein
VLCGQSWGALLAGQAPWVAEVGCGSGGWKWGVEVEGGSGGWKWAVGREAESWQIVHVDSTGPKSGGWHGPVLLLARTIRQLLPETEHGGCALVHGIQAGQGRGSCQGFSIDSTGEELVDARQLLGQGPSAICVVRDRWLVVGGWWLGVGKVGSRVTRGVCPWRGS